MVAVDPEQTFVVQIIESEQQNMQIMELYKQLINCNLLRFKNRDYGQLKVGCLA